MKTITREYRGHVIASFDRRQLGDREVHGRSYSVYPSFEAYKSGADSLSCRECIDRLSEAKAFIDAFIQAKAICLSSTQ